MQKLSWILNIILVLIIAIMLYMFFIVGNVKQIEDGRTAILVTKEERVQILADMRKFLEHVQTMVESIGEDDMASFSTAASGVGLKQERAPAAALIRKLPIEFKTMGMQTHEAFDNLAKMADEGAGARAVAKELSLIMENCTYCHETFRLEAQN